MAVVLCVYFPALYGGVNSIDDPHIISFFSSPPPLMDILLPGGHYYYRPIIELSYYQDSLLWGMEPRTMHLENVLIHLANVLLVFLLAQTVAERFSQVSTIAPLFAALLFALHPLNVEAVSWIAGRTDPLATLFSLSALVFWIRWLNKRVWQDAVFAIILFLCAMLTKEVAVALIPVAVLLAFRWSAPDATKRSSRLTVYGLWIGMLTLIAGVAMALYRDGSSLSQFMKSGKKGLQQLLSEALIALGFYMKKLCIPVPLNFAITEVSPFYGIVGGITLLTILVYFHPRGKRLPLFLIAAVVATLPAVLVAVHQVAWTPYSERYMYLPVAFIALGTGEVIATLQRTVSAKMIAVMVLLLCAFGVISHQRVMLWQNQLEFYRDTVAKSPDFGAVHNELGTVLMRDGRVDEAAREFEMADRLNRRLSIRLLIKANIIGVKIAQGDLVGARNRFFEVFKEKKDATVEFLELLHLIDSKRLLMLPPSAQLPLALEMRETLTLLYERTHDPFMLYRLGQNALISSNRHEAAEFFKKAYVAAPADAHYRMAAMKYVQNIEGGKL